MPNLPKFLVQKLGVEKVRELYHQPAPDPLPELDAELNRRLQLRKEFYKKHSSSKGIAKTQARVRWQKRVDGFLEPVETFMADEAIEKAGL